MSRSEVQRMRLDTIEVTGFKSIRGLKLKLRRLNVLIGSNGAGKSNFITLFRLLNDMVEQRFQLFVRQQGGADTFLHFGQKNTDKITIYLTFGQNCYDCAWVPTVDDKLIFAHERCLFFGGQWTSQHSESLGSGHEESKLPRFAKKDRYTSVPDHVYKLPTDFPGFAQVKNFADPYQKVTHLEERLAADIADSRFIPYIQLHEFEGLLFKYQTKSFLTQCWYNTSSTSNRFSWHIPHDLMR